GSNSRRDAEWVPLNNGGIRTFRDIFLSLPEPGKSGNRHPTRYNTFILSALDAGESASHKLA
ncbi:MAG: hypothetical protein WB839_16680, partial [Pseudolabrys sp.]